MPVSTEKFNLVIAIILNTYYIGKNKFSMGGMREFGLIDSLGANFYFPGNLFFITTYYFYKYPFLLNIKPMNPLFIY